MNQRLLDTAMSGPGAAALRQPGTSMLGWATSAFPVRLFLLGASVAGVWAWQQPTWPAINRATAIIVASLSNALGVEAGTSQLLVWFGGAGDGGFQYYVTDACSAISIVVTYAIAVLAYPVAWDSRLSGLLFGIPVLVGVNIIRLVTVGWVGLYSRSHFDAVHSYGWPVLHVAGVGLLWMAWAWRTSSPEGVGGFRFLARVRPAPFLSLLYVVLLTVLAFCTNALRVYGEVVSLPGAIAQGLVLDDVRHESVGAQTYVSMYYVQLVAVPALFLAAPVHAWRLRLGTAARLGVPIALLSTLVLQMLVLVTDVAGAWMGPSAVAGRFLAAGVFPFALAMPVFFGLLACRRWMSRVDIEATGRSVSLQQPIPGGDIDATELQ